MTAPETKESGHTSVLLQETIEGLAIRPDDTVVDATIGGAGHFRAILSRLGSAGTLVGIDADGEAVARARLSAQNARAAVHTIQGNFRDMERILDASGIGSCDKFLFDLGWSGYQLLSGRGFSFLVDEPLLMTYGSPEDASVTAADIVNSYPERDLANLLYELGEETRSRIIARAIVDARGKTRIISSLQLADIVSRACGGKYGKRHPATKTFQALRIAVNEEYSAVREGISSALLRLSRDGRIAVITFHSGEDRIVKQMFREAVDAGRGSLLTKKPILPSREELDKNPRARSAKLRIFVSQSASLS